jgi:hypothetical protein
VIRLLPQLTLEQLEGSSSGHIPLEAQKYRADING